MSLAEFSARHLLVIPVVALAAYMPGRRILRRLRFESFPEELAACCGLGMGLIGSGIFLLGLAGGLRRAGLVLLAAAVLASGGPVWRETFARVRDAARRRRVLAGTSLAILLTLPAAVLALYPPTGFDSTLYHLPVARAYAEAHRIVPLPFVRFSEFPQLDEMFAAAALSLSDDVSAQEIQVVFFLLAACACAAAASRMFSRRAGWLAGVLWLASPYAVAAGTSSDVEAAAALFGILAVLAAGNAVSSGDLRWASAAGAFAGFAAGTKYLGLFFVLFTLCLLAVPRREIAPAKAVGRFALAAALAGGAWYVRTAVLTGNPVFPFFGRFFGRGAAGQGLPELQAFVLSASGARSPLKRLADVFGTVFNERLLGVGPLFGALGLAMPAAWIVLGSRSKVARRLLAGLGAFLVLWAATARNPRFLVPALPLAIVLTAAVLTAVSEWLAAAVAPLRAGPILLAAAVVLGAPAMFEDARHAADLGAPPHSDAAQEAFLAARFPEYPCYRFLNELHMPYTVFGFYDERMTYYARGARIGDYFGPAAYSSVHASTGRSLDESLRRLGAGWVMFSAGPVRPPEDAFFPSRFRLACETAGAKLYEILPQ